MQIVIDIPEEQYITLNAKSQEEVLTVIDVSLLIKAIKNGTPLPTDAVDRVTIKEYLYSLGQGINVTTTDEDCISRQKAINAIDELYLDGDSCVSFRTNSDGDALIGKYQAITALDDLPPVTAQPKMGHWEKDEYGNIHCTFCGCNALYEKIHYPDDYFGKVVRAKSGFCPTCGAKMQEVRYGE